MSIVTVRAEISFNTVYAAYQHEHVELHHPRGGNAKYLEGPVKQYSGMMAEYISARVRTALSTGRPRDGEGAAEMIARETEEAVGAFAEIVGGQAVAEAPIKEGTLRGSMEVHTERAHELG
jgi:hypothetical protein